MGDIARYRCAERIKEKIGDYLNDFEGIVIGISE